MFELNRPSSISDLYFLMLSSTTGLEKVSLLVLMRSHRPSLAASASWTCTHHWVAHLSPPISKNGVTPFALSLRASASISSKFFGSSVMPLAAKTSLL